MQTGTVKWFNDQKGFGFIAPANGGPDVFVHKSAVERAGMRSLHEGQKLRFELQDDPKSRKTSAHNLQDAGQETRSAANESADEAEDEDQDDSGEQGEGNKAVA